MLDDLPITLTQRRTLDFPLTAHDLPPLRERRRRRPGRTWRHGRPGAKVMSVIESHWPALGPVATAFIDDAHRRGMLGDDPC